LTLTSIDYLRGQASLPNLGKRDLKSPRGAHRWLAL